MKLNEMKLELTGANRILGAPDAIHALDQGLAKLLAITTLRFFSPQTLRQNKLERSILTSTISLA